MRNAAALGRGLAGLQPCEPRFAGDDGDDGSVFNMAIGDRRHLKFEGSRRGAEAAEWER